MTNVRDTSIETYHDIIEEGLVGDKQIEVLKCIGDNPNHTDTEIAKMLGYSDMNKTRPRRKELVDLNLIVSNGKKICNFTGRNCYQWILNPNTPSIDDIRKLKEQSRIECPTCKGKGYINSGGQQTLW